MKKFTKRVFGALTAGLMSLNLMSLMPVTFENETINANAADFSYPVQEFRMGIGDTNRNINISGMSAGDYLNSWTTNGVDNEKWYLNYISSGVYEIVNVTTGYVITNDNGLAVLSADTDSANQRWNIVAVQQDFEGYDLYYKITSNANSSLALTFNQNSNSISVDTYTGDLYQKFKLNLDGLEGFAANAMVSGGEKAGTIGGLLGETVFVDTVEECVAAMKRTEPLTIVVTANLEFNDWDQADQKIEDDKTIVGSYSANIIYNSRWRNDDFYGDESITPSCNIVLRNLHFRATQLNSYGCGVILVYIYSGRNIWFDHNDFSATFSHDRDNEVGKFIWINTPSIGWSDDCYNGISPDYITISYNHFNNRYWTVAYGTQNTETTRCRTTLMFNKWENCARRTPQIGNGTGHVYNSYHTYSISDPSQQIIAGDGCKMLTEYCYFEGLSGLEFAGGGSSSSPFRDTGSVSATSTSSSASAMNKSFSYSHSWAPGTENYGYSLITANNTKSFCNSYAGSVTKLSDMKYITDSDLQSWVWITYPSPFLKDITVGSDPVGTVKTGAVIDTSHKYMIKNSNSGLYLEVEGSVAANGTNVCQGTTGANVWSLSDAGDGYYKLYSEVGDGATYLLDLDYGKVDNGTNIGIWSDTASDAQSFKFVDNGDGTYTITTKSTEDASCLGIVSGSAEEGANVVQWECDGTANQSWILEIYIPSFDGTYFKNVKVEDVDTYKFWSIDSAAAVGDVLYGDRTFTYTTLPDELIGAETLITSCDAKYYDYDLATFTAGADMILYVAFDVRVATLPSWMSGWTDTGLQFASSNEVTFAVYSKEFSSGEVVTLGTNGQSASCINYVAFAQPQSQEIVDDIIWGDANADGIVNSIDATMVTRSALNAITLSAEAQACCDVNRDGIINSIDATIITRYALKVIEQLPVA